DALSECTAVFVPQYLSDAAELIDKACDPGVRGAHHWPPRFNKSENSVGQVLIGPGAMQEPTVVCYIHEQIGLVNHELSRQLANGVFKANQRRNSYLAIF